MLSMFKGLLRGLSQSRQRASVPQVIIASIIVLVVLNWVF